MQTNRTSAVSCYDVAVLLREALLISPDTAINVINLAEDSTFSLSVTFGALRNRQPRPTSRRFALSQAVLPGLSAYLAVNSITFDGKLPPVTLNMRHLESILSNITVNRDTSVFPASLSTREEQRAQMKKTKSKERARAIGRAMHRISITVPRVTLHHAVEASYLGSKLATEKLATDESHDSGFSAIHGGSSSQQAIHPSSVDEISLALIVEGFSLQICSVNQSNSSAIRQIFGRQTDAEAQNNQIIRGLEFDVKCQDLSVKRFDNGHVNRPPSSIFSTGRTELKAMTTVFSELLGWPGVTAYIDEPNYHLLQIEYKVHHFDLHASLDMITQLILESRTAAAHRKMRHDSDSTLNSSRDKPDQHGRLHHKVPKMTVVCEVGKIDIRLSDSERHPSVKCRITNSGLHVAGHTEHYDVCARILNRDPKSKHRFLLSDGFTSGVAWDCGGEIAQTKIAMCSPTIGGQDECFEIVKVGQGFLKSRGSILGRANYATETLDFDPKSRIGSLTLSFSKGIDIRLWRTESHLTVAALLTSLEHCQSMLRRPRNDTQNAVMPDPLRTLPSGISIKLSLGTVSTVLASQDPNPACHLKLVRGLHLQTALTLDYCYFAHEEQVRHSSRLLLALQHRSKLHLSAGLETEAEALANKHTASGGGAALFSVTCKETLLEPVFNALAFTSSAQTPEHFPTTSEIFPAKTRNSTYAVWDFQKKADGEASQSAEAVFSNNRDPFGIDYAQQIRRPILTIPDASISVNLLRQKHDTPIEQQVIGRMSYGELSGDLSHIHCALMAHQALKNCHNSRPAATAAISTNEFLQCRILTTLRVRVDYFEVDILFPIGERLFGSLSEIHLVHRADGQALTMRSGMFFVPSAREDSKFEELGRFKTLAITVNAGKTPVIAAEADAFRIRVPYKYEPSKLFLNISAAIKASRILLRGVSTTQFRVQMPRAQAPKAIPNIAIRCKATSFEIKDDPLETKLNLSFRVGKTESGPRAERRDYFRAKEILINNLIGPLPKNEKPTPRDELERLRERYDVTLDHTIPIEEARARLLLYDSERWIRKLNSARGTQNRREQRELIRQYGYKTDYSGLPIEVVSPQRFAPLFRASLGDLHVGLADPKFGRAALLDHMEARAGAFPPNQEFSLLVPLEIQMTSATADLTLRDYPLPLWRIMPMEGGVTSSGGELPALVCNLTMVVAEELAQDEDSFFLIPCVVMPEGTGDANAAALELKIAKTLAPVKSYADVKFNIHSPRPTDFAWGVSYSAALADLGRAFASFSHPPRDPSPRLGFWDKIRQSLHWRVAFDFTAPCHLHLKGKSIQSCFPGAIDPFFLLYIIGSRDPYEITGHGAGFVLAWMGNTRIRIGYDNPERELVQIFSEQMVLSVPEYV